MCNFNVGADDEGVDAGVDVGADDEGADAGVDIGVQDAGVDAGVDAGIDDEEREERRLSPLSRFRVCVCVVMFRFDVRRDCFL